MFKRAKNIDTAFQQIRLFTVLVILVCSAICGFVIVKSYELTSQAQGKIYVLANGKIMEAISSSRKDNISVEAIDHIKTFHHYFFTLSPDDGFIQEQIRKALYLADQSAKQQYDNLRESNYYSNLIAGNASQLVKVDSIQLNLEQAPFYFKLYGKQEITRPSSSVTRNLITEGFLREVPRSENNSHGFLIEKWKILNNRDISIKNR